MSCHNVVLFSAMAESARKENKLRQYGVTHEMRFPQVSYRAQHLGKEALFQCATLSGKRCYHYGLNMDSEIRVHHPDSQVNKDVFFE